MLIVDTDILIDIRRGHAAAGSWFVGLGEKPSVPGVVVMELIQGAKDARQVRSAFRITSQLPKVWPTDDDRRRALADFAKFHLSHRLGLVDALIASCAVGLPAELCTFNQKHHRVVPGLVTIRPYLR